MSSPLRNSCRVLYVDDSQADQQILREAINLANVPVELVTAATGPAALQLLADGSNFHVLLLDWNLPGITGMEFLSKLRAAHPTVLVTILTGEPRLVDAPTAATLGAKTIVKKPLILDGWEQLASRLYEQCGDAAAMATART